jgi:hypothetical protein
MIFIIFWYLLIYLDYHFIIKFHLYHHLVKMITIIITNIHMINYFNYFS